MMKLILWLLIAGCALINASVKVPGLQKKATIDATSICNTIKFVDPTRKTATRESVLKSICDKGVHHVALDDKQKQFAIFNIHRDGFITTPKWVSGQAEDVVSNNAWEVNDIRRLSTTGYQWYSHGLPIWPLPFQALPSKSNDDSGRKSPLSLLKKPKVIDWPNYGIATPLYFASNAWRNQAWSMEEFFQEESKVKPTKKEPSKFSSIENFHKLAKTLMTEVDSTNVEAYSSWPFLKHSLAPMMVSVVRRNKGICPDELYIYTRFTPCHPREPNNVSCTHAALQARNILTQVNCRNTDVIQGYSQEFENNAI